MLSIDERPRSPPPLDLRGDPAQGSLLNTPARGPGRAGGDNSCAGNCTSATSSPRSTARGAARLAIDPKPSAGHPGFELLPALRDRWDDVVATGDVRRAVRRRFDLLVDVLELDRAEAAGWTLARVLQNAVWAAEEGEVALDQAQRAVAEELLGR